MTPRAMLSPLTHGSSIAARYGFAVFAVVAASVLRSVLTPALGGGVPFILYFPTVVLCAWYGGLGPGLLSAALGGLIAWYAFIPPQYSFAVSSLEDYPTPARQTLTGPQPRARGQASDQSLTGADILVAVSIFPKAASRV